MLAEMISWLLAVPLLGLTTGLRTFTPMAVLCWFAYSGNLDVDGTWASWTSKLWVAILFTVLAAGEWVGDKLPQTPNRTSTGPLLARAVMGGVVGSIAATSMNGPGVEGVLLGVVCAVFGAFGGYTLRHELVQKFGCPDWPIAVAEDLLTLVAAISSMRVVTG